MKQLGSTRFVNIKGIVLLIVLVAIVDTAVAYGLSPLLTDWAVQAVNRHSSSRVIIEDLKLHPALLSLSAKSIEAADPDNSTRRMFLARSLHATLDPIALLAGRMYLGSLTFKEVELVLVKDAQGTFNVEKLLRKDASANGAQEWASGVKDWIKQQAGGSDWVGQTYDKTKKWVRKSSEDKASKVKTINVLEEPRGRIVSFDSPNDATFKIGQIRIDGGRLILWDKSSAMPPLEDIRFSLTSFALRRAGGFNFAGISAAGKLRGGKDGSFDLDVQRSVGRVRSHLRTERLDLALLKPLYEDSSPVAFQRGYLTLDCKSELSAAAIDSQNKLKLEDYEMTATTGAKIGPVPASVIVDALNRRPEFEIKFSITGDPDRPSFKGFETTLWDLVKDDLGQQALETLESKTGLNLSKLSEKLKTLF